MPLELNLNFPNSQHVIVSLSGGGDDWQATEPLDFTSPLIEKDYQDIRWYLEKYAVQYSTEIDDDSAQKVVTQLPILGKALFNQVFFDKSAFSIFKDFQDEEKSGRLLTITSKHPVILALPWELLHNGQNFLIYESPRISIRRRISGKGGGRKPFKIKPKQKLHLLFVISRPTDASFINPRADAQAVLNALDERARGRVRVEFLRPATLKNLRERLEDEDLPHVDILHFDGHGIFDSDGSLAEKAQAGFKTLSEDLKKEVTIETSKNTGYLLFEKKNGETDYVSASIPFGMFFAFVYL